MKFIDINLSKFYFNSFLITFSAFMGAILSLLLSEIFKNNSLDLLAKISFSVLLFIGSLLIVMFVLYKVIFYLGSVFRQQVVR